MCFLTVANFLRVEEDQSFCLLHSATNSLKTFMKSNSTFCFSSWLSFFSPFVFRLNASLICAGVGVTSCTSNSLNTFCISVYCRNSSALISDALCFSLLVQPFLTRCLSVSHFSTSILYPVVNSIRWLAKITRIRIGTFFVTGIPSFLRLSGAKMIFLLICIIGCVWKWHPKIHPKNEIYNNIKRYLD